MTSGPGTLVGALCIDCPGKFRLFSHLRVILVHSERNYYGRLHNNNIMKHDRSFIMTMANLLSLHTNLTCTHTQIIWDLLIIFIKTNEYLRTLWYNINQKDVYYFFPLIITCIGDIINF